MLTCVVCCDVVCVVCCVELMCVLCCEAIWKVIRSWLSAEQRDKTLLVTRQDMSKYVASDQLEEHMVAASDVS